MKIESSVRASFLVVEIGTRLTLGILGVATANSMMRHLFFIRIDRYGIAIQFLFLCFDKAYVTAMWKAAQESKARMSKVKNVPTRQ